MIDLMIYLPKIFYDIRARDGTWCRLPYHGHPKGCPNFPICPQFRTDFEAFQKRCEWYATIWEFDLLKHACLMKLKHPDWSERQCRNLLYWQGTVRRGLKSTIYIFAKPEDIVLEIPEAHGVNVFETMALVGIELKKGPDIVKKIMMIGRTWKC